MERFPSELRFVSFLQYSPGGRSPVSCYSRDITYAIKSDGLAPARSNESAPGQVRAIARAASRLADEIPNFGFLQDCFGPDVTLIPIPRSAPLVAGALWPTFRICEALTHERLAKEVRPYLQRITPVQRSSTAAPGARPSPQEHFSSVETADVDLFAGPPKRITLVDDVITRGSTMVGLYPRVLAAFPDTLVTCFALIRTRSGVEVEHPIAPTQGTIVFHGENSLQRSP